MDVSKMFHVSEGLYFGRLEDGSVQIVKEGIMDVTLDAEGWCSVIAMVSGEGAETAERHMAAKKFHGVE